MFEGSIAFRRYCELLAVVAVAIDGIVVVVIIGVVKVDVVVVVVIVDVVEVVAEDMYDVVVVVLEGKFIVANVEVFTKLDCFIRTSSLVANE